MKGLFALFLVIFTYSPAFSQNAEFVYSIIDKLYSDTCHCAKYVAIHPSMLGDASEIKKRCSAFFPGSIISKFDSLYLHYSKLTDSFNWDQSKTNALHFLNAKEIDSLSVQNSVIDEERNGRVVKVRMTSNYGLIDTVFKLPRGLIYKRREKYIHSIEDKLEDNRKVEYCTYISYPLFLDDRHAIIRISGSSLRLFSTFGGTNTYLYSKGDDGQWKRKICLMGAIY